MKTKICKKCNTEKSIKEFYYHRTRHKLMDSCKECNSKKCYLYQRKIKVADNLTYQLRIRAAELKRRARHKGISFEIDMFKCLKEIYSEQKGKCYYTDVVLETNGYEINNPLCFVVDRINPELGYVKGNMVFCCNAINKIKSNFSIRELKEWVSKIKDIHF